MSLPTPASPRISKGTPRPARCPIATRSRMRPSLPSLAEMVTSSIRATDVAAPWDPASLALLLVDAETPHLPSILRRLTARLGTIAWSAGGSCYPNTATHADDMVRQAVDLMARAKDEGGNRLYVAS